MESRENLKMFNYKITGNPEEADHNQHYSKEIEDQLYRTYLKIQKGKIKNPQDIQKLIKRYPNVPAFKNYLVVFYGNKNKWKKARVANDRLMEEHPDYLFGKLNHCVVCIQEDLLDEVPKTLGEALDLKDLYPNREIFHETEFTSFLNTSCNYLLASENIEAAESRIKMASDILGETHPTISNLNHSLRNATYNTNIEKHRAKLEERNLAKASLPQKDYAALQTTEPPVFHHPEILELYQNGLEIKKDVLEKILALPRTTLLEDLEKVLLDSIYRFEYFYEKEEEEEWDESTRSFPLHALFLITELEAKEKLPMMFNHFSERDDIVNYWYNDHIYETFWQLVYRLAQDDLEQLKAVQFDSTLSSVPKIIIHQAVNQIAFHQPEREAEIVNWYHEVIDYFLENVDDPLICDTDVVSNIIAEICDFSDKTFLPKIKVFYDMNLVDVMLPGDYEEVQYAILEEDDQIGKNKLFDNMYDQYQNILKIWGGYKTEADYKKEILEYERKIAELETEIEEMETKSGTMQQGLKNTNASLNTKPTLKVGRNEPCLCGSGKKYKKCCY